MKPRLAAARIAAPMSMLALTTIGDTQLGKRCTSTMRRRPLPLARAASTNVSWPSASVLACTSRTYPGHHTSDSAIIALRMPGPSAPTTARASTRAGTDRNTSVTRMIVSPRRPPTWPATMPSGTPRTAATTVMIRPICSDTRAPRMTRV